MKKILLLIVLAFLITILTNKNEYVEIPASSIKMRVIANSDTKKDQDNKVIIKSILLEKINELIKNKSNLNEIDTTIKENENLIQDYLKEKITLNDMDYSVNLSYGFNYFPEKELRGIKYKSGYYNSLVVTLGEGRGENWWCVMYPPICLIDENVSNYEYHSLIKDALLKYN